MILKNFSKLLSLFIIIFFTSQVHGDEKIDIWKNQNLKKNNNLEKSAGNLPSSIDIDKGVSSLNKIEKNQKIQITDGPIESSEEANVFGVYDPEDYNFNLNMWSNTNAEDVRASIKRLKKIKLSKTSNAVSYTHLTLPTNREV